MYGIKQLVRSMVCVGLGMHAIAYGGFFMGPKIYQHTLYGDIHVTHPLLIELIESEPMQRLKRIHQYGVNFYVHTPLPYDRFEHSLGVLYLLQRFGASLEEQVAGLLHDVSHTVFSHVGDHFKSDALRTGHYCEEKNSYQDDIHIWYLAHTEIADILTRYDLTPKEVAHKLGNFKCLEQDLPDICADRFEYNLMGGYIENKLTHEEVHHIINHVRFENDTWYFTDAHAARLLADASLYLTEHNFGSVWNGVIYQWAAAALRRAVQIDLLSLDDIHFSIDDVVWETLMASDDGIISTYMNKMINHASAYHVCDDAECCDLLIKPKFRGTDPLVMQDGVLQRLSSIDNAFYAEYARVRDVLHKGYAVRFIENSAQA